MADRDSGSQSVVKAFALLDHIAASGDAGISIKDASVHLSMSKSTAYRYLVTLEEIGAVVRDERDTFHLGLKIVELDGALIKHVKLIQIAWPIMKELANLTEETVHLAMPWQNEIMYVAKVDSIRPIGLGARNGARAPLCCTASGKAILSKDINGQWLPRILRGELLPQTPSVLITPDELEEDLAKIREQGYAVDNQGYELGVCSIGSPIVGHDGNAIGAISMTAPASRMGDEHIGKVGSWVQEAALDISRQMGYTFSPNRLSAMANR